MTRRMRALLSALALGLSLAPLPALPLLAVDPEPLQGDLLVLRLSSDGILWNVEASLRYADGKQTPMRQGVYRAAEPGGSAAIVFMPLPMRAAAGPASLFVSATENGQAVRLGRTIDIKARDYAAMDIKLDSALTDIKAKPDPAKDEQSRILTAILYAKRPEADYLDGPFIRPIQEKAVTATYGDSRRYLYASGGSSSSVHTGLDLHQAAGSPIQACGRGRVVMAQSRIVTGNTVVIEHQSGLYSLYYHMESMAVAEGDIVERGQVIGKVGSTGLSTGPHLHWELRLDAEALDPESMIGLSLLDKILPITKINPSFEGR
jgi:murein DD-endopeptidase MepM/ murein hydrolase activator NlpD